MARLESLVTLCALASVTGLAAAALQGSSGPPVPGQWLACEKDADCTSVEMGCDHWQPVRRQYATSVKRRDSAACTKSTPAGPKPASSCVQRQCVNGPYTVRYWKLLGDQDHSPIQYRLIHERMQSCLRAAKLEMSAKDSSSWSEHYFRRAYQVILEPGFSDEILLDVVLQSVIPCEELVDWQRAQDKWEQAQEHTATAPRVRVEHLRQGYSFDDVYPPLIEYARAFQRCGAMSTREGFRFWGDMHAQFSIRTDGTVDPASMKATYPAASQMRRFVDCASGAFKDLSFPAPRDVRPVSVTVLIQIPANDAR
jgi:hypothetical protein